MTLLGKLLVFFNLAVAVALTAIAFVLWTASPDWTGTGEKGARPGEFKKRADKLDELWKRVPPVQVNWQSERNRLTKVETHLDAERAWYDKEIRFVLAGPAKGQGVRVVSFAPKDDDKAGIRKRQVLVDDKGFPVLVPPLDANRNPLLLQSLAEYNVENKNVLDQLAAEREKHQKQIAEAIELTGKLTGDKAKGLRGLHERIADEKAKNKEVLAELKLVEPRYVNTAVEAQLINKRHAQMVKRIEELKKLKVARSP
jgi:hypothetical protein